MDQGKVVDRSKQNAVPRKKLSDSQLQSFRSKEQSQKPSFAAHINLETYSISAPGKLGKLC